jgi:hypothetical protein
VRRWRGGQRLRRCTCSILYTLLSTDRHFPGARDLSSTPESEREGRSGGVLQRGRACTPAAAGTHPHTPTHPTHKHQDCTHQASPHTHQACPPTHQTYSHGTPSHYTPPHCTHQILSPQLGFDRLAELIKRSHFVLTDSGGLQEEVETTAALLRCYFATLLLCCFAPLY